MAIPGTAVKIVLVKGGVEVGTIRESWATGSNGKGSFSWPIPLSLATGRDYKVSVQSISQPTVKDQSDTYLTITSAPSKKSTLSTSQKGWKQSTTQAITQNSG